MPAEPVGAKASNGRGSTLSKTVVRLASIEDELRRKNNASADVDIKVPWIKSEKADMFFGLAIFLNTAFIGLDVEVAQYVTSFPNPLWVIECIFLVTFAVEITLRIHAERPNYKNYFDKWGCFDFSVTVLGIIDAWVITPIFSGQGNPEDNPLSSFTVLRVFRLIRLVRLIRVLRMFSELVVLVQTIGNSMKAVAWMSLLLGMIMYTGSVITVLMLGQSYPDDPDIQKYFGSLGSALFSHFCVVTLEGWPDIANSALAYNSAWALYFVFMIVLTNFALVNLMVGVIVERIINFSTEQENALESFVAESDQFRTTLHTLFDTASLDPTGIVTREEVRNLLEHPHTHDIFMAVGINPNIPPQTLHNIMDLHRDGPTNFQEFFEACLRLCGSKHNIHSVFVQSDICEAQRTLINRLSTLEEQVVELGTSMRGAAPTGSLAGAAKPVTSKTLLPAGAEASIHRLLERMDRFGQVQTQISAEMCALQEIADNGQSSSKSRWYSPSLGPALVESKGGREVGGCCVDSLFAARRPAPTVGAHDPNLKTKVRKELEAEFRSKQVARSPRP